MNPEAISRRNFIAAGTAMIATHLATAQTVRGGLTAGEVKERIRAHVGMPWLSDTMKTTVDNIVAGDAGTPVRGIATTTMATLEVLQKAVEEGKNMVISHETPYYFHPDKTDDIKGNATLDYKLDFIRKHNIAIMHMHDHWHHRKPDGIAAGMVREMGWQKYVDPSDPKKFTFPGESLLHFTQAIQTHLQIRTMRVVGHPSMQVRGVYANWGYVKRELGIELLSRPDIDALVTGETQEWEVVEFVQDMIASGQKKALVLLGHVASEEGGMRYCADWLRTFITEVPISFIPAPEPFWNPSHPKV
jgi:putative NIF3 family GTP cyclohydrolase 1 type 2